MVVLETLESPFFHNRIINRRLTEMNVWTVLDNMASTGHPEWIDLFTNWAVSNRRRNEIFTVFELIDQYPDQEFQKMDAHLMNGIFKAGATLSKVMDRPNVTPIDSDVRFVPTAK
jgi:hypothetical protein